MRYRLLVLTAAVACVALGGCTGKNDKPGTAAEGNTIKIGHYASLSGKEATFGQQVDNGVKLAVDEINNGGGIGGKKIELITEDTQSQTQGAQNAVEKLIGKDEVSALIGEVASGRTMAAAPIAMREKTPMLTPASTREDVTKDENGNVAAYIFRICFIDPFQGTVMAKFAFESLNAKSVAVLKDNANPYSVGLAKAFVEKFKALGGTIVEEQAYEGGQNDFKAQLTAIKGKNPQAIFVPGYYTEVSLIATQARQLGITVPLLGGDGWDSPTLTQGEAKTALEGCYFSNHYSEQDTSAAVQDFIKRYKAKFNGEAPGAMSALGYDAMMIIAKIIKDSGKSDRETIRAGLAALKNYKGVTGNITIDEHHNATKPAVVLQIKDGKFAYHSTVNP
ncbi:MAG: ABC transporter substrate-binding protein [Bacteroidetes bacterium]|nr:ABC transporter substrate-binding protein [Bacteroidota bacterium]